MLERPKGKWLYCHKKPCPERLRCYSAVGWWRCVVCHLGSRGFRTGLGHTNGDQDYPDERSVVKFIGQKPDKAVKKPGELPEPPGGLLVVLPATWEYLTADRFADGKTRELSSVSIFVEGSQVKACLNDKACKRSLYVTGESLETALHALERLLAAGTDAWRYWKGGK